MFVRDLICLTGRERAFFSRDVRVVGEEERKDEMVEKSLSG